MIVKERKKWPKIIGLEALIRRTAPNHSKRKIIEGDLSMAQAGYWGEQSLDYYFKFLPEEKYRLFHNLRLAGVANSFFEMDSLLLSKSFFPLIEVKNFAGTLYLDEDFDQLIRNLNGKEEHLPNPIAQVELQQRQLRIWLNKNKFPDIPIYPLVVFTNPTAIIKTSPNYVKAKKMVIRKENLLTRLEQVQSYYDKEILTEKQLKSLSRLLLKRHLPPNLKLLETYEIKESELLTGVHCPKCFQIPMKRNSGTWICKHCSYASKSAHIDSLKDYALLISPTITNQQLRAFLNISSISVASKLLSAMKLKRSGTRRQPIYELPQ